MMKAIKTKRFKVTAALLALALTISCITWTATRAHAAEVNIGNTNVLSRGNSTDGADYRPVPLEDGSFAFYFNTFGDTDAKYTADCEQWRYTGYGWSFIADESNDKQQLLWKGSGNTANWVAIYPYEPYTYSQISKDYVRSVPADQTNPNIWKRCDVLYAKGETTTGDITINFKHLYSKLTVNLTYGTEVEEDAAIASLAVGGTETMAYFDIATDSWSKVDEASVKDIMALGLDTPTADYEATYEALIIPQTAAPTINITINDRVFTVQLSNQEFQSGTQYNITLQVGQDKVTLGGITADRWTPATGGPLETE